MSRSRRLPIPYIRNLVPVEGHKDLFEIKWEGTVCRLPAGLVPSLKEYFSKIDETSVSVEDWYNLLPAAAQQQVTPRRQES